MRGRAASARVEPAPQHTHPTHHPTPSPQNARLVAEHNAAQSDYHLVLNRFADLTFQEFERTYLGARADAGGSLR